MFIHLFDKYEVPEDVRKDGELNMISDAMGDACVMVNLIDQLLTGAVNDFNVTEGLLILGKFLATDGQCLFFGDTLKVDDHYGLAEIRPQLMRRCRQIDDRFTDRLELLTQ